MIANILEFYKVSYVSSLRFGYHAPFQVVGMCLSHQSQAGTIRSLGSWTWLLVCFPLYLEEQWPGKINYQKFCFEASSFNGLDIFGFFAGILIFWGTFQKPISTTLHIHMAGTIFFPPAHRFSLGIWRLWQWSVRTLECIRFLVQLVSCKPGLARRCILHAHVWIHVRPFLLKQHRKIL